MRRFAKNITHIVGIDEAGRGPLAGPVAVGAFCIKINFKKSFFKDIRDSKKLTFNAREKWFKKIKQAQKEKKLDFKVAQIGHEVINDFGINKAVKIGIKNVLKRFNVNPKKTLILLDGLLKAPKEFVYQETIIKGDEKEPVISCASIVAKVLRDRKMNYFSKKFPKYKFEINKGYGTKSHIEALRRFGPSNIHRLNFLKNILNQ